MCINLGCTGIINLNFKHATQRSRSFIPFFLLRCLLFLFYLNMINKGTQYDNKRGKIQTCDSEEQACSFLFFFAFFLLRLTDLHGNLPNLKYLRVILLLWERKQEEKRGGNNKLKKWIVRHNMKTKMRMVGLMVQGMFETKQSLSYTAGSTYWIRLGCFMPSL